MKNRILLYLMQNLTLQIQTFLKQIRNILLMKSRRNFLIIFQIVCRWNPILMLYQNRLPIMTLMTEVYFQPAAM